MNIYDSLAYWPTRDAIRIQTRTPARPSQPRPLSTRIHTTQMSQSTTRPAASPTDHPTIEETTPWVERCQRQFSSSDRRLHNLVDDENHAMHGGV